MARSNHESLTVYGTSLDVVVALDRIATDIRPRRPDLCDQLRRASASIPLNIAEGAEEFSPAEKARFYRMARRSAAECMASLDVCERVGTFQGDPAAPRDAVGLLSGTLLLLGGAIAALLIARPLPLPTLARALALALAPSLCAEVRPP